MSEPTHESRSPGSRKLDLEYWLRRRSQALLIPLVRLLAKLGLTPNMLTIIGLLLNAGVAVVLARGALALGGGLLLLASGFDALDGTLARLTGRESRFGAFFDSSIDRYSEAVVYGGLLLYFVERGSQTMPLAVYAAIIGSLMVSYTRARAEGLGIECRVGLATRADRMVILAAALLLGRVTWGVWLVALLANLTAVQRMVYVWRRAQETDD